MSKVSVVAPRPGYFGKVPTRGDFVSRGLSRSFIDPLDTWLQRSLAQSQITLGDAWLTHYLKSPFWRYALSADVCGDTAWVGVMMPSVDHVGRYFPFTIACPVEEEYALLELIFHGDEWFGHAEKLAFEGLGDHLDLDEFTERVEELALPELCAAFDSSASRGKQMPHHLSFPDAVMLKQALYQALGVMLRSDGKCFSIWWTTGATTFSPSLIFCWGLPNPERYSEFIYSDNIKQGREDQVEMKV